MSDPAMIESISAATLATHDMARAVRFYRMLGFEVVHGGDTDAFTSFRAGRSYLNLVAQPAERRWSWWGRVIFYHSDVDALHASIVAAGHRPDTAPRDAEWGGTVLSFDRPRWSRTQLCSAIAMIRRSRVLRDSAAAAIVARVVCFPCQRVQQLRLP